MLLPFRAETMNCLMHETLEWSALADGFRAVASEGDFLEHAFSNLGGGPAKEASLAVVLVAKGSRSGYGPPITKTYRNSAEFYADLYKPATPI